MKSIRFVLLGMSLLSTTVFAQEITAYFNHNEKTSYIEPYRKISRSGDNLELVLINQIKSAKESIYIAVQEFRLPLVADALIARKKEGIDVRVVLEHDYNNTILEQSENTGGNNESQYEASKLAELRAFVDTNKNGKLETSELEKRDALYKLRQEGVDLIDDASDGSRGSGLMHHKFMIIDTKVVTFGSANYTMSCIHGDVTSPVSRGNPNSFVTINSASVAKDFNDEFMHMWGKTFGQQKPYRGPRTYQIGKSQVTIQFSPTSIRNKWEESVNGLIGRTIRGATKSVLGALFVFSDQKIADELEARHNQGVGVSFIIEPKFAYRDYSELLDILGVRILNAKCEYEPNNNPWGNPALDSGMAILPQGDVLHHKFAVIDGESVIIGSQNWSDSANSINDETLVVIQDSSTAQAYSGEFLRVKQNSLLGRSDRLFVEIKSKLKECSRGIYSF